MYSLVIHSSSKVNHVKRYMNLNNISFTHLYNAMSDNNHRNPGALSAALSEWTIC